jgi:hypothetical protein
MILIIEGLRNSGIITKQVEAKVEAELIETK